jgi:Flp pilus assembly pilin Flp
MSLNLVPVVMLARFARDVRGVTGSEYALIASLIALVIISGLSLAGGALDDLWAGIGNCMNAPSLNCM